VPNIGKRMRIILIALRAISTANSIPFFETTKIPNFNTASPETVKGITIKKNRIRKNTQRSCNITNLMGILDKNKRASAIKNPATASVIFEISAIDIIKIEQDIIFTLGSHE